MNDLDPKKQGAAASSPPWRSGDRHSSKLDRLLRSAAQAREEVPAAMPFGFDTRVAALWRAQEEATAIGLTHLVRAVALIAVAVIAVAGAGTYREATVTPDTDEPFANEYVIADSTIQTELLQ
ncbi:MAG TPA: hypothetical protein VGQ70_05240 [Candidatus Udaeobacter sp.]|jgi:hypothetical protein|nr:hypothetical protein [Candidatus Udaeobacter sp.]